MSKSSVLSVDNLTRRYVSGDRLLTVLDAVSLDLPEGAAYAVMGHSGSGKTTLLGLCAGLDQPDANAVYEVRGVNHTLFPQRGFFTTLNLASLSS